MMWEIKKQWEDESYDYIEYENGTVIQSIKGTPTAGVDIKLPPSLEERITEAENMINLLLLGGVE